MSHCTKPCDVHFVGLQPNEHDWASIDPYGREHCGRCSHYQCIGSYYMYPAITSEMLRLQRLDYVRHYHQNNLLIPDAPWGTMEVMEEFRKSDNYYAPGRWTMYDPYDGDQNRLWLSRWDDGEVWSGLKSRDLAHSNWMKNLI